jgi:hypothetical protein
MFPLDPIRGNVDIYGAADSAHMTLTSIGCMGWRQYKCMCFHYQVV